MFQIGLTFYENFDYTYSTVIFLSACTLSWYFKSCLVNIEYTYKMPGRRRPNPDEYINRRAAHVVVSYKEKLFLWGGYMELPYADPNTTETSNNIYYHSPREIYVYNIINDTWVKRYCTGDIPPPLSGCCAAVHNMYMYIFGGYDSTPSHKDRYFLLGRMNLETFSWQELKPHGFAPYVCDKSSCWVYKNRFYIFGGYGPKPTISNRGAIVEFVEDDIDIARKGWLSQFCYLDIEKNTWVWPDIKGEMPTPRAAHAATVLGNKAYIFGGRLEDCRLCDLYCVDLDTNEWRIQIPQNNISQFDVIPQGRSWHTFDAVTKNGIILYGGFSNHCRVFSDIWLWDINQFTWTKLLPTSRCRQRLWHRSAQIRSGEIVFIGGISNNLLASFSIEDHVEEMLILRFSPPSLYRTCLEYASKNIHPRSWEGLPKEIKDILEQRTNKKYIHAKF